MFVGFGNMGVTSNLSQNHFGGVLRTGEKAAWNGLESELEMKN